MSTDNMIIDTALAYLSSGTGEADAKTLAKIAGRREDLVTETLMGAVLAGELRRVRNEAGALVFKLPAGSRGPAAAKPEQPAPKFVEPAAPVEVPGLPAFVVTMQPALERASPPGQGKWDALFSALMAAGKPANGVVPTVELPLDAAKAVSTAGRTWAKKRKLAKCPFSFSKRDGKCVVQRVA